MTHGGTEMGQGIHTKVQQVLNPAGPDTFRLLVWATWSSEQPPTTKRKRVFVSRQVASRELHIPRSKVYVGETSTSTVPNSLPSAASFGTDANGMAVKATSSCSCCCLPDVITA